MHNGIEIQTIKLRSGVLYTPENGKEPVFPCRSCCAEKRENCEKIRVDHPCYLCDDYMDYENMLCLYRHTVFD